MFPFWLKPTPMGWRQATTSEWATWEKQVDPQALSCRGPSGPLTLNFLIGPAPVFTKDFGYPLGFPFKLSFEPSGNTPNRPSPLSRSDPQLAPQLGIIWALVP